MNLKRLSLSIISACMLVFFVQSLKSQDQSFSSKFQEAIRLDDENELSQSLNIWTELAQEQPNNYNVNYKAGRAYLLSFNQKSAALPFLQRAIKSEISKNYDPLSPFEKKVPVEVFYYYAKALHLTYNLDKAEEHYENFIRKASSKHYLYEEAELGLHQIANAKVLMAKPVDFDIENLGTIVNSEYPDYSPVISVDENALFFTSRRLRPDSSNYGVTERETGLYFEDIYVSYKDRKGNWQTPELLEINSNEHNATVNVSIDGQTLYIYKDINGGDIYESRLVGEMWTAPVPLTHINSSAWETHVTTTADGETMYFVSDRKGGLGGRDIYRINKLPDGKWGKPMNLGPKINTPYDEDAVFISPDNRTLYFSSKGHDSMGGFDIMYSTIDEDGEWGEPVNIGYPINTTDDDVFFVTSPDGRRAYYSSFRESGYGEKDIYILHLAEPPSVNLALLKGTIIPADGDEIPDDIVIRVNNRSSGSIQMLTPRTRDGIFVAILPPCNTFDILYFIDGKQVAQDSIEVPCDVAYQEINKELLLSPLLVLADGTAVIMTSTFGDAVPANFKKYFGYNERTIQHEEEMFANFMTGLQKIIAFSGKAEVSIVGSASTVPTRSFKNNQDLANQRAQTAKQQVLTEAEKLKIDTSKIEFKSVVGKIQGPEYKGDYDTGGEKYGIHQYIEINAR